MLYMVWELALLLNLVPAIYIAFLMICRSPVKGTVLGNHESRLQNEFDISQTGNFGLIRFPIRFDRENIKYSVNRILYKRDFIILINKSQGIPQIVTVWHDPKNPYRATCIGVGTTLWIWVFFIFFLGVFHSAFLL